MSTTKTLILRNGEVGALPRGATIDSIVYDGAITVTSNCILPTPTSYKCGYFYFLIDSDDASGRALDELDTFAHTIKVGDTLYIMDELLVQGDGPGTTTPMAAFNQHILEPVLFSFKSMQRNVIGNKQHIYLYFTTPASLWDKVELDLDNGGSHSFYKPFESECGVYPSPA